MEAYTPQLGISWRALRGGRSELNSSTKASNLACCWRLFLPGRAGRLLSQGHMHALMAAVLLRLAGMDPLDLNAEPEPPYRQAAEIEQAIGGGKRDTVIGTDA